MPDRVPQLRQMAKDSLKHASGTVGHHTDKLVPLFGSLGVGLVVAFFPLEAFHDKPEPQRCLGVLLAIVGLWLSEVTPSPSRPNPLPILAQLRLHPRTTTTNPTSLQGDPLLRDRVARARPRSNVGRHAAQDGQRRARDPRTDRQARAQRDVQRAQSSPSPPSDHCSRGASFARLLVGCDPPRPLGPGRRAGCCALPA